MVGEKRVEKRVVRKARQVEGRENRLKELASCPA